MNNVEIALKLEKDLEGFLSRAEMKPIISPPAALIAPHAGYAYSGPTAAYAYKYIDTKPITTVFILGPSHHVHLDGCALSGAVRLATPLRDLVVDTDVIAKLKTEGDFKNMSLSVDEDEHSIEMHLPYLAKVFASSITAGAVRFVPVMVGNLSPDREREYGAVFAPYLDDPSNLFVVSSDFCHWGKRFRFTFHDKSKGAIHESIAALDHAGMDLIAAQDYDGFIEYDGKFHNTICGRHPIGVLLCAMAKANRKYKVKWTRYAQSTAVVSKDDSSVSYASAVISPVLDDSVATTTTTGEGAQAGTSASAAPGSPPVPTPPTSS